MRRGWWRRGELQGAMGLEANAMAGVGGDAVEEGRIEGAAEGGEREQGSGIIRVINGEHAGRGLGGFVERRGSSKHENVKTGLREGTGERETDDTGTGDADICESHGDEMIARLGTEPLE